MNLRTARILLAALCALGAPALEATAPTPLQADQFVIDQDQSLSLFLLARLSQQDLWQSFQQSSDVISGAGVFLFPGEGTSGQIRIELWNGPPKAVPGSDKGDRLAFADADGVANAWVDVFWTPQTAESGRTYFLVFEGMGQGNQLGLGGAGNVYPRGSAFVDGTEFPNFDATFRTFGPAIPEPASALLLLAGLAALGAVRMRRRPAR